jgi:DNA (cytosine-5)-methyltransferase 1
LLLSGRSYPQVTSPALNRESLKSVSPSSLRLALVCFSDGWGLRAIGREINNLHCNPRQRCELSSRACPQVVANVCTCPISATLVTVPALLDNSPTRIPVRAPKLMGQFALEICAGAGGQALGLEDAGFTHAGLVEIDRAACATLRANRSHWAVIERDVREVQGRHYKGIDLLAGGVPCPPFSIASKQLGQDDDRDLFPEALRLAAEAKPTAVLLENVRGFASDKFISYRRDLLASLERMGYRPDWRVIEASGFGVPQLRPRFVLVALRPKHFNRFRWPEPTGNARTVGESLFDLMSSRAWAGATQWAARANTVAPTIVGGSHKHGGPDLGPTRARNQWASLGVDGLGIANEAPGPDFPSDGAPKLTTRMVARLQGFPDEWQFFGGKTAAYRQVGNAFPPPVASAVAAAIRAAINPAIQRSSGDFVLSA